MVIMTARDRAASDIASTPTIQGIALADLTPEACLTDRAHDVTSTPQTTAEKVQYAHVTATVRSRAITANKGTG
ncbi:hypothetical protein [Actinomadura sp. 3N407]|uniref:hypothetical protein n=1 Tax=Actinomadura sp. 3N407 TaxID=3457423 RepID=UPI003FCEA603